MKQFSLSIVVIVLLAAGFGGWWYLTKPKPLQIQDNIKTSTPVLDETANWKTYDAIKDSGISPGNGFVVRYPPYWYVRDACGGPGCEIIISDYELKYRRVPDESFAGFHDEPVSIPAEHCQVAYRIGFDGKTARDALYENTHTSSQEREKCDINLKIMKSDLRTDSTK